MISLNDILHFSPEQITNTRIRFNKNNGEHDPIKFFNENPEELLLWNYHNNKHYKPGQYSIGLVSMGNDKYLLFTIGKILSYKDKTESGVDINYETLDCYSKYFGRLIVRYHNKSQNLFRTATGLIDEIEVSEILPTIYDGFEFPGYENVTLTYSQLKTIVEGDYPSYRNALAKQKAVYLQTDKLTGKLYVGSATSDNGMLLARWGTYVSNGHGGNEGLKELIKEKGFDYIKNNFQYTILENFNASTPDEYVLSRECYWKEVLSSRKHGYNRN